MRALCLILVLAAAVACGLSEVATPTSIPKVHGHYCDPQVYWPFRTPVPVMPDELARACEDAKQDYYSTTGATAVARREEQKSLMASKTATAAPLATATAQIETAFVYECPERLFFFEGMGMFEDPSDPLESEAMKWCRYFVTDGMLQDRRESSPSYRVGDPKWGFLFPEPGELRYYRSRVDDEFGMCLVPRDRHPYFKLTFPDMRDNCRGMIRASGTPPPDPLTSEIKYEACLSVEEVGYENHSWKARDPAVLELFKHVSLTTKDGWEEFCAPIVRDDYVTK